MGDLSKFVKDDLGDRSSISLVTYDGSEFLHPHPIPLHYI